MRVVLVARRRRSSSGAARARRWGLVGPAGGVAVASVMLLLTASGGPTGTAAAGAEASPVQAVTDPSPAAPVRLRLPAPTGRYSVGTVTLHLIDRSRHDPWVPAEKVRELMVQLWYPAGQTRGHPRALWMAPQVLREYIHPVPVDSIRQPVTAGFEGAPVMRGHGLWPVVLFSHGFGGQRGEYTALLTDLASHGYLVAAIDHTHESLAVQFPGRPVKRSTVRSWPIQAGNIHDPTISKAVTVRRADARFVIDQLTALDRARNVDAERQRLPDGLAGSADLSRIGMFGQSLGGATTGAVMHADRRVRAGINLDGYMFGPASTVVLDQPFLLFGSAENNSAWVTLWPRLHGWRAELTLVISGHNSFSDLQTLLPQHPTLAPSEVRRIGGIDPDRSILAQRTYIRAFFDQHLLNRPDALMRGPSAHWPEIEFLRLNHAD